MREAAGATPAIDLRDLVVASVTVNDERPSGRGRHRLQAASGGRRERSVRDLHRRRARCYRFSVDRSGETPKEGLGGTQGTPYQR